MARSTTKELTSGSPIKLILGFAVTHQYAKQLQQYNTLKDTNIDGRYLGTDASALGKGIYVVGGKKIVK